MLLFEDFLENTLKPLYELSPFTTAVCNFIALSSRKWAQTNLSYPKQGTFVFSHHLYQENGITLQIKKSKHVEYASVEEQLKNVQKWQKHLEHVL